MITNRVFFIGSAVDHRTPCISEILGVGYVVRLLLALHLWESGCTSESPCTVVFIYFPSISTVVMDVIHALSVVLATSVECATILNSVRTVSEWDEITGIHLIGSQSQVSTLSICLSTNLRLFNSNGLCFTTLYHKFGHRAQRAKLVWLKCHLQGIFFSFCIIFFYIFFFFHILLSGQQQISKNKKKFFLMEEI